MTVDGRGRLLKPTITKKAIGFVTPEIEDPNGGGAAVSSVYSYTGPIRIKELLPLQNYIDCVGHPALK